MSCPLLLYSTTSNGKMEILNVDLRMVLFSVIKLTGIDIERLFEINYLKCLGGFLSRYFLSVCYLFAGNLNLVSAFA